MPIIVNVSTWSATFLPHDIHKMSVRSAGGGEDSVRRYTLDAPREHSTQLVSLQRCECVTFIELPPDIKPVIKFNYVV